MGVIVKFLQEQDTQTLPVNELDKPITETEVRKAFKLLKPKKAAGLDRVRNEMLKCGINQLVHSLVKLFYLLSKKNHSRTSGLMV